MAPAGPAPITATLFTTMFVEGSQLHKLIFIFGLGYRKEKEDV